VKPVRFTLSATVAAEHVIVVSEDPATRPVHEANGMIFGCRLYARFAKDPDIISGRGNWDNETVGAYPAAPIKHLVFITPHE